MNRVCGAAVPGRYLEDDEGFDVTTAGDGRGRVHQGSYDAPRCEGHRRCDGRRGWTRCGLLNKLRADERLGGTDRGLSTTFKGMTADRAQGYPWPCRSTSIPEAASTRMSWSGRSRRQRGSTAATLASGEAQRVLPMPTWARWLNRSPRFDRCWRRSRPLPSTRTRASTQFHAPEKRGMFFNRWQRALMNKEIARQLETSIRSRGAVRQSGARQDRHLESYGTGARCASAASAGGLTAITRVGSAEGWRPAAARSGLGLQRPDRVPARAGSHGPPALLANRHRRSSGVRTGHREFRRG